MKPDFYQVFYTGHYETVSLGFAKTLDDCMLISDKVLKVDEITAYKMVDGLPVVLAVMYVIFDDFDEVVDNSSDVQDWETPIAYTVDDGVFTVPVPKGLEIV